MKKTKNVLSSNDKAIRYLTYKFLSSRSNRDFNILYNRIYPNLRQYVYNLLKPKGMQDETCYIDNYLVDDLMQDVSLLIYQKIDKFNPLFSFTTWAYKITFNYIMIYKKKAEIKDNNTIEYSDNLMDIDIGASSVLYNDDVESKIYSEVDKAQNIVDYNDYDMIEKVENERKRKLFFKQILESLYNLPDTYKDILIDREINKLSYDFLAHKYNLPIQTIKNRIFIGRQKIKQENNDKYKEFKCLSA